MKCIHSISQNLICKSYANNIINFGSDPAKFNKLKKLVNNNNYIKDYQYNNIYENISYNHNFELCVNIIRASRDDHKNILAKNVLKEWIFYYIDNINTDYEETIYHQCLYFIDFLSDVELANIIYEVTENNVNNLSIICNLFDTNIKNYLLFDDIECNSFLINYFGKQDYKKISNIFFNLNNNIYNKNTISWFVINYMNNILENLDSFTDNINNNITEIFSLIKLSSFQAYTIFKKSIYNSNLDLFNYLHKKHFKNHKKDKIFKMICLNTNPNLDINNTIFIKHFDENMINYYIYEECRKNNIINIVNWLNYYYRIDHDLHPIINNFFSTNLMKISNDFIENDCMICYDSMENNNQMCYVQFKIDNSDFELSLTSLGLYTTQMYYIHLANVTSQTSLQTQMITLNCHKNHTICSSCLLRWYKEHNTCPMCKKSIKLDQSILHIYE
jgi:hypothetical protein